MCLHAIPDFLSLTYIGYFEDKISIPAYFPESGTTTLAYLSSATSI